MTGQNKSLLGQRKVDPMGTPLYFPALCTKGHIICHFLFALLDILGPVVQKLAMSFVNVSLKFQMVISNICQYFLLKKCEKLLQCKSFSHFFNKNFSVFGYKVLKHLTS